MCPALRSLPLLLCTSDTHIHPHVPSHTNTQPLPHHQSIFLLSVVPRVTRTAAASSSLLASCSQRCHCAWVALRQQQQCSDLTRDKTQRKATPAPSLPFAPPIACSLKGVLPTHPLFGKHMRERVASTKRVGSHSGAVVTAKCRCANSHRTAGARGAVTPVACEWQGQRAVERGQAACRLGISSLTCTVIESDVSF